jgi:hypothetical protein
MNIATIEKILERKNATFRVNESFHLRFERTVACH